VFYRDVPQFAARGPRGIVERRFAPHIVPHQAVVEFRGAECRHYCTSHFLPNIQYGWKMGRLDVRVVEAKDLSKPVDTQVKLRLENKSYKTSTVKHSMNPRYDEVFRLLVQDTDSSQLRVELIERGAISDSVIGTYDLSLSGLYMGEVADKWIKLKKTKHGREEVHLRVSATDFGLVRELKPASGATQLKAASAAGSVSASPTPPAHGVPAAPGVSQRHGAPGQCAPLLQPSPSSSVYLPPSSPQHTISSSSNHSQQYSQQLAYPQRHHQYPPHYYLRWPFRHRNTRRSTIITNRHRRTHRSTLRPRPTDTRAAWTHAAPLHNNEQWCY
jgi:hypothetical protein